MACPAAPNVIVDVYRTANPSSPYTLGAPGPAGVKGYLWPEPQEGRNGTANFLKWTHTLGVNPGIDIRDAYNSQLDPSRNNNIADTVILKDTHDATKKTAFYVVMVLMVNQGTNFEYMRVYLDRFQPSAWPTDAL